MWDDARSTFDEPFYLTRWVGPKLAVAIVLAVLYLSIRYQLEVHSDVTTNVFGLAHAKANLFLFLGASGDAQWYFSGGGESFVVRQDVIATTNPFVAAWAHMLDRIVRGTWIATGLLFAPPALWHSLPILEEALTRIRVQWARRCERNTLPEESPAELPVETKPRRRTKSKAALGEQLSFPFAEPDGSRPKASSDAIDPMQTRIVRRTEQAPTRPPDPASKLPPALPPPVTPEKPRFVPGQARRKPQREDK
ncbi:hypothetical protein [Croceicoccus mobilis]|uniref:Uncharacterized protein n=1 Tax=Croceicoccus mobilis TaxID=1703339 RepID=A0A916Z739_9SPHN|nr:hypothetical protein [Croceicoccus mobilis]GGD79292.1 hypothetical protein GCM10010990_31460 [Croceicoccus mobilis]